MRKHIGKRTAFIASFALLVFYSAADIWLDSWVFRPLSYQVDASTLNFQYRARNLAATILKPDSHFQTTLAPLRNDTPHPDVVLVNIDSDLIAQENTWPLPRRVHTALFNKLATYQPKVLAVDLLFEVPQTPWVLEAIGERLHDNPDPMLISLYRDVDHDLQMKRALQQHQGKYVLISVFAKHSEATDEAQRNRLASNLFQQIQTTNFNVRGTGEALLFPYQRILGIRQSVLPFRLKAGGEGYAWVNYGRYGTADQSPLFHRMQTKEQPPRSYYLPNFATETVRVYEGATAYSLEIDAGRAQQLKIGNRVVRTDPAGEMLINFYGRKTVSRLPIIKGSDLLHDRIAASQIKNKIVIYGTDSNLMHDYLRTPVGEVWGTEVIATEVSNILNGDYFYRPAWALWLELTLFVALGGVAFVTAHRLKPLYSFATMLALLGLTALIVGTLFVQRGEVVSVTLPASFLLLVYFQNAIMRFVHEERDKRLLKNALGLYLSPQLTEQVVDNPKLLTLEGSAKELTVLFSDIRDFTSLAETMAPEELTSFLHQYFSPMTDIVFETGGTLDKYIGDAIMAFWGAPIPSDDHAVRACDAALRMLDKLDDLRGEWAKAGYPSVDIGIGISTGLMRVGNMGSDRRLSYTVMGDHVNLGSRLEGLTKYYGVRLVVADTTWGKVKHQFYGRELDLVKVKGKQQAVPIYEIIGRGDSPEQVDLDVWAQGITAYRRQDWGTAEQAFKQWQDKMNDPVAAGYLDSIKAFRLQAPPTEWDGVRVMETK